VGGGTSDFSLIQVSGRDNQLFLERLAVGEHLLLGGDNMDLTLTYRLSEELKARGTGLDSFQFQALWNSVRLAKEKILAGGADAPDELAITIPGRGSSLIGGTIKTVLTRQMCQEVILDGFLPSCSQDEAPVERARTGLQELGLPYCSDTAITRHLAAFLKAHAPDEGRISYVLFNGGVFKAGVLRQRILDVISGWEAASDIRPLSGTDLDLAVSLGAAHFGLARRGDGIRIRGGVPRTYYIGIESAGLAVPGMPPTIKALCIVPKGLEEGSDVELPEK
jgi:molecular chaperone DnaK (HSP70)